jgi:hypothetical protein
MKLAFARVSKLTDLSHFEFPQSKKKDKKPSIDELLHCEKPMTVCIAMMARDAETKLPAIVFAADRQRSNDLVKFEGIISKFQGLQDNAGILMASDSMTISYEIIDQVIESVLKTLSLGKRVKIEDIANLISEKCLERYKRERGRDIQLKWGTMLDTPTKDLYEVIREDNNIFKYDFEGKFIVFGIDENPRPYSGHIFTVNEKGLKVSHDAEGYAIIGNGEWHAFFELTRCKCTRDQCLCLYHPNMELSEVIIRAYNAKKAAERTGMGVGESTHMGILRITADGDATGFQFFVDSKLHDILDSGRNEIKKFEENSNKKTMRELDAILPKIPIILPPKAIKRE